MKAVGDVVEKDSFKALDEMQWSAIDKLVAAKSQKYVDLLRQTGTEALKLTMPTADTTSLSPAMEILEDALQLQLRREELPLIQHA